MGDTTNGPSDDDTPDESPQDLLDLWNALAPEERHERLYGALRAKWTGFVGDLHEVHVTATELRDRYVKLITASLLIGKASVADEPEELHADLFDQFLVDVGHERASEIMYHVVHLLDPVLGDEDADDLIVSYHGADPNDPDFRKPRELRWAPPSTLVARHGRMVETFRYNRRPIGRPIDRRLP